MRRVLLLGATGLVGRELLTQLLADSDVSEVRVVARRATGTRNAKLIEHVFDLAEMEQHADVFAVDQIFCALGTTIKVAGSQERFRFVDHDLPLTAARLGLAQGARHYLLVSALGASRTSRVFYNRVKGELEDDLRALGYRSLTIAQPSLLLGPRTERRLGEEIAKRFGWLTPPKYRPIEGADVARALVDAARRDEPGVRVLESRAMRR
ncbi:MAG TPA: NAD(P)H-binding protein [Thermoanaerobaculia bacterium]|nr:NAD(P)H-binding protein [Thermoanaerobaculia bacterium]